VGQAADYGAAMSTGEPLRVPSRPARWPIRCLIGDVRVVGPVPTGPVLLCSNHPSYRDVFLFGAVVPGARLLVDPLVFAFPFLKRWALRWGFVPVAIPVAVELLQRGEPVAICPTGLVEACGEDLLPYKTGAVRIAAQAGVPLVPMRIRYGNYPGPWVKRFSITTQNILLVLLWPFFRRGATVTFGEPFRVAGLDVKAETAELRRRMLAL
jgi:1-acyl-sn-glycerol-3-phosphate acyltransferase